MPVRLELSDAAFETAFETFLQTKREVAADVSQDVAHIIDDVQSRGDTAVIACAEKFEGQILTQETLRISEEEARRGRPPP
ncbi:MAG: histidinol dehydrogenase, partial [Rhodospirillaceae bacterium]|nr:histidinol dehydrogenase [Rhodospirillaceae bacterium]